MRTILLLLLCWAVPTVAGAQGTVRDGIEYVYALSLNKCILYPRSQMEAFIAGEKLHGGTFTRLLEDDGWRLRLGDGSGVITWYAKRKDCEHFRAILNAVKQ